MDQNNLNDISNFINQKISEFLRLPDTNSLQNVDWTNINSILSLLSNTLVTAALTIIILWLIRSIGIYTMARKRNDELAFLAFVPYFCFYTMGKIIKETNLYGIKINRAEFILPALIISMSFPFAAPISITLFVLVYNAILYRIYQEQCPNFSIILVILSVILPFVVPFILFFIRNGSSKNRLSI